MGWIRATDTLWQNTYQPKLRRFLNNTQQENGEFILALTLGGEGRTVNFGSRQNAVATTMPDQDPRTPIYVFAHEVTSSIVSTAVNDNTTPTEQRAGLSGRLRDDGNGARGRAAPSTGCAGTRAGLYPLLPDTGRTTHVRRPQRATRLGVPAA